MTFKAELFLIVGLIAASLVLAPMLEGTGTLRPLSAERRVALRGPQITVLHTPVAGPSFPPRRRFCTAATKPKTMKSRALIIDVDWRMKCSRYYMRPRWP